EREPKKHVLVWVTCTAVSYKTRAEASLSRLSPLSTANKRRGRLKRSRIAVAAIGSVGPSTAPRTNAGPQRNPSIKCATSITAMVVVKTNPIAKSEIGRQLSRKSRQDELGASQ